MSTRALRPGFTVSYQSVYGRPFRKKKKKRKKKRGKKRGKTRRRRVARAIGAGVDFMGWYSIVDR